MLFEKSMKYWRCCIFIWGNIMTVQASIAQHMPEDRTADIIEQLRIIKTTQSATVVIVPPYWSFRVGLNESTLREIGCTFITKESAKITVSSISSDMPG